MSMPMPKLPDASAVPVYLPAQRVADLGSRISRTLGVARALAESGRMLDLRGIEDGVGRLCAQTLDLPADEAHSMVFMLREILTQVDALTEILAREERAGVRGRQIC
jgi:hypothetical protein